MQIGAVDSWGENCFNEYVWPRRHVHPKVLLLILILSMKELCETLMSGFWVLHLLGEASLSPLLPSPGQI